MPHLAPLSWALATLFFWALLLALSATLWWQDTPKIYPSTQTTALNTVARAWKW